jgi:hypothetical protein
MIRVFIKGLQLGRLAVDLVYLYNGRVRRTFRFAVSLLITLQR